MKKTILICHNELGIRESLRLILEEKYDLKLAKDGNDCLKELLVDSQIEAVIMATKLPRMNCLAVLKQIKTANPEAKVIVVTNYRHVEAAEEAIRRGARDCIIEPFSSKDVLETVAKTLK